MQQLEVKGWTFIKDFETKDGRFFLYDKGIGFKSPLKQKEDMDEGIEYFSFCEEDKSFVSVQNNYICIDKDFIDYKVVIVGDRMFALFLYSNNDIKPTNINGCFCGDISVSKVKRDEFHFACGHTIISSKKIEIIKDFSKDVIEYNFKNFTK